MADGRGGYQQPSRPAAVSGPGALSARTDGRAGTQPVRVAPGGPYGSRQALEAQQQAAPMPAGGSAPPSGGPGPGGGAPSPLPDLFGPTDRPGEPITSGVDVGAGPGAPQPLLDGPDAATMWMRQAASLFPDSPDILDMLDWDGV